MGLPETDPLSQLSLPPGFRFYPTDEELMVQYLCRKIAGHHFSLQIIGDIDLYKFDPWDLPSKAIFGEKEWYFFSPRDRKYPNGSRPNRVAGTGYWKATGTDKVITTQGRRVGIKKALVFYVGKAPKGTKTNWIMHEYRLFEPQRKNGSTKLDDWVLCRIYKKSSGAQKPISGAPAKEYSHGSSSSSSSQFDDMLESLTDVNDRLFALPRMNSLRTTQHEEKVNLQNPSYGNFDWASLAGVGTMAELGPAAAGVGQVPVNQTQGHLISNNNTSHDMYVPSFPQPCLGEVPRQKFGRAVEEEVQSGLGAQRVENSAYNSNAFTQGLFNSFDSFSIGYPNPAGQFGFRQ